MKIGKCRRCADETEVTENRICVRCREKALHAFEAVVWKGNRDAQWAVASEVKDIAQDLIAGYRPDLAAAYFYYVFIRDTPASKGREVWGRVKVVGGLASYLMSKEFPGAGNAEPFFVMEIAADVWNRINYAQKIALVDHELSHCYLKDDMRPGIGGHDVEEFVGVMRRQGTWRDSVRELLEAAHESESMPLLAATVGESTPADFH